MRSNYLNVVWVSELFIEIYVKLSERCQSDLRQGIRHYNGQQLLHYIRHHGERGVYSHSHVPTRVSGPGDMEVVSCGDMEVVGCRDMEDGGRGFGDMEVVGFGKMG